MKTFILIALISSSFVYALSPEETQVNEQDRRDKFAGVSRIRTWENEKKDSLYRDLENRPLEEVAEKYKDDFSKEELKDLKQR